MILLFDCVIWTYFEINICIKLERKQSNRPSIYYQFSITYQYFMKVLLHLWSILNKDIDTLKDWCDITSVFIFLKPSVK